MRSRSARAQSRYAAILLLDLHRSPLILLSEGVGSRTRCSHDRTTHPPNEPHWLHWCCFEVACDSVVTGKPK